jgi:hypothetical protein
MFEAVLPGSQARAEGRAIRRRVIAAAMAAAVLIFGGGWLWADWGPLIAFDSLVSFCF